MAPNVHGNSKEAVKLDNGSKGTITNSPIAHT